MRRFVWLYGVVSFALAIPACQRQEDAGGSAEDSAEQDTAAQAAREEEAPILTRAEDAARDAGEKPEQVMDELAIGPGSRVADVMAGGGYYTYLLSERVGPEGMVYATGAQGVARRMAEGDLADRTNIKVVEDLSQVEPGTLDAILVNRAYHLLPHPETTFFPQARAALKPGGIVGVIEVRLSEPEGHDMKTHRMGERTVREEVEQGGFTFAGDSDILANPDDPRTDFMEGERHLADRMFLKFEKPEETAPRALIRDAGGQS
jgi:predicted methyltransferase